MLRQNFTTPTFAPVNRNKNRIANVIEKLTYSFVVYRRIRIELNRIKSNVLVYIIFLVFKYFPPTPMTIYHTLYTIIKSLLATGSDSGVFKPV